MHRQVFEEKRFFNRNHNPTHEYHIGAKAYWDISSAPETSGSWRNAARGSEHTIVMPASAVIQYTTLMGGRTVARASEKKMGSARATTSVFLVAALLSRLAKCRRPRNCFATRTI